MLDNKSRINSFLILLVSILLIISVTLVLAIGEKEFGFLTFQLGNQTINVSLGTIQKEMEFGLDVYKAKLNDKTRQYIKDSNDGQEDDFIIIFKDNIKEDILTKTKVKKQYKKFKSAAIRGKVKDIKQLIENNEIKYLELDQNLELLEENIPYNIEKTKAPDVWNVSQGKKVKVAILDTGISKHEDLKVKNGVSFVSPDFDDNNGHGTQVAGVIAALLNKKGIAGVAPSVDLYAVKIMESSGGELSNAIAGIEWAIDNEIDIVSMSFGMETYSQIFKEVLNEAYGNNILLIAASGNGGNDNILYPARYTDVIAVGAIGINNEKASFSSYGYELELVAPGVDINTTSLNNGYASVSGTSFAAPHVAGVAALIKAYNQSLTNEQIRGKLQNDALDLGEEGKDGYYGYGLVQVDLEASDYTYTLESYYYEIYNITKFLNLQYYHFWLNGTGIIDDVNFSEGFYLVNKTINGEVITEKYNVTENGTLVLLGLEVGFSDDFTEEGSSGTDGVTWQGGTLNVFATNIPNYFDGECYEYGYVSPDPDYTECFYGPDDKADCISYSQSLGAGDPDGYSFYFVCQLMQPEYPGSYVCEQDLGGQHSVAISGIGINTTHLSGFFDCDGSSSSQNYEPASGSYYVIDRKKALCTGDTTFDYQGRYDSGSNLWITYKSTSCPSGQTCDSSLDEQEVTTKTGTIPDPCMSSNQTDLAILDVIPVQVIPDVNMVKGKSGYVRVIVHNNGPLNATGQVNVTFDGSPLTPYNPANASKFILNGMNGTFDFSFKPEVAGNNKIINANVTVIE